MCARPLSTIAKWRRREELGRQIGFFVESSTEKLTKVRCVGEVLDVKACQVGAYYLTAFGNVTPMMFG